MKTILLAKVLNPYRSHVPAGFYDPVKGHSGVDLEFTFEDIPAPCDLTILLNNVQNEMGNTIYAKDDKGYIHVFAHQKDFYHKPGDRVLKFQLLGHSGDTGNKTTGPHLHYEILAPSGTNPEMKRLLLPYEGDNVDPLDYLAHLEPQSIPDYAKISVEKAIKKGITDWSNPELRVGDATLEAMLIKCGVFSSTMGYVTKARFAVALDRLHAFD